MDIKPFRVAGRLIGVLAQVVGDTAVLPVVLSLVAAVGGLRQGRAGWGIVQEA